MKFLKSQGIFAFQPALFGGGCGRFIRECGIQHLLIDLPSVDKEKDEGKLLAQKPLECY
jgi:hypothetical protein